MEKKIEKREADIQLGEYLVFLAKPFLLILSFYDKRNIRVTRV